MVEVFKSKNNSKNSLFSDFKRFLFLKKAQGLPMYAIGIIIIGLIVLAVLLIFIFGTSSQGSEIAQSIFGIQENVTIDAAESASAFAGS